MDSTDQSPEAGAVRAATGDEIGFDFGEALIPTLIEARLYEGDRVAASFMRWPEDLPGGVQAVKSVTLLPSRTPVLTLDVTPGRYSLVVHALWDMEAETFFATGVDID